MATHDDDAPELTPERAAKLRPARDVLPDAVLSAFKRGPGRPKVENPKAQVTLRIDRDILEHFKSGGPGWQTRINDALARAAHKG